MRLLAFDTATPATVVGAVGGEGEVVERRHDPRPGERPGHAERLLALADEALAAAGLRWGEVERIGVGVGPGTFTGLRIGVATARALAQALDVPVAAVSTLEALAAGARHEAAGRPVLAVLDARRGEAFVAAYAAGRPLLAARAVPPEELAALAGELVAPSPDGGAGGSREPARPPLAVGDGAVLFRAGLEAAGAAVPEDPSALHRVGAAGLLRLTAAAEETRRDGLVPDYVREPDARPRTQQ